jgi:hypothetical protein
MRDLFARALRAFRSPTRAALIVVVVLVPVFALLNARNQAPDFPLSRSAAISAARHDPQAQKFLRSAGADRVRVSLIDHEQERITFFNGYRLLVDVAIDGEGKVTRVAGRTPGTPESGSTVANRTSVLLLLTALFVLATATMPLLSLRNLDVLVAAGLTLPVWLLNQGLAEPSVWVVYPLLAYLAFRCMRMGMGGRDRAPSSSLYWHLASRWPRAQRIRALKIAVGMLVAIAVMVVPSSTGPSDVTQASLAGATGLLHGTVPYGHIPDFIVHGDTYPLLNYVAYMPAALLMPVDDAFDDPMGGLITALIATMIAAAALYRVGKRLATDSGPSDAELDPQAEPAASVGLRTALGWLAFPPVILAASGGTNDAVLSACLALVLLCFNRDRLPVLLLGIAAWIKVIPVLALPIWLARMPRPRALQAVGVLAALSAGVLGVLVALGGLDAVPAMFKSIMFQMDRSSLRSLWVGMGLAALQPLAQAILIAAVVAAVVAVRRDNALRISLPRMAALLAGIELIAQITANYSTWAYTPWVMVPLLVSLLAPATARGTAREHAAEPGGAASSSHGRAGELSFG